MGYRYSILEITNSSNKFKLSEKTHRSRNCWDVCDKKTHPSNLDRRSRWDGIQRVGFSQGSKDSTFLEEGLPSFPAFFFWSKNPRKAGRFGGKEIWRSFQHSSSESFTSWCSDKGSCKDSVDICPPIDSDQSPALKTYPIPASCMPRVDRWVGKPTVGFWQYNQFVWRTKSCSILDQWQVWLSTDLLLPCVEGVVSSFYFLDNIPFRTTYRKGDWNLWMFGRSACNLYTLASLHLLIEAQVHRYIVSQIHGRIDGERVAELAD